MYCVLYFYQKFLSELKIAIYSGIPGCNHSLITQFDSPVFEVTKRLSQEQPRGFIP